MSGYGRLQTLLINMFGQTYGLKIHNNSNFWDTCTKICNPLNFSLTMWEKFALPNASPNVANNKA